MQNNNNANTSQEIQRSEQRGSQRPIVEARIIGADEINRDHNGPSLINRIRRATSSVTDEQLCLVSSTILSVFLIGFGSANIRENVNNYEELQQNNMNKAIQIFGIGLATLTSGCGIYKCISGINFNNSQNNQDNHLQTELRIVVNPDDSIAIGTNTQVRGSPETLQNRGLLNQEV